jgi:hypothetical protein
MPTYHEEQALLRWYNALGIPVSWKMVENKVNSLLALRKRNPAKEPWECREQWAKRFLSRHPEISQVDESIRGKIDNQRARDMEVHISVEPSVSNSVSANSAGGLTSHGVRTANSSMRRTHDNAGGDTQPPSKRPRPNPCKAGPIRIYYSQTGTIR